MRFCIAILSSEFPSWSVLTESYQFGCGAQVEWLEAGCEHSNCQLLRISSSCTSLGRNRSSPSILDSLGPRPTYWPYLGQWVFLRILVHWWTWVGFGLWITASDSFNFRWILDQAQSYQLKVPHSCTTLWEPASFSTPQNMSSVRKIRWKKCKK